MSLPARYVDVAPISPGQNATVYVAKDAVLDRTVFLKVYPFEADDLHSALREPQLLTQLAHPQLVAIYRVDELEWQESKSLLLEMEYLSHGTFNDLLRRCADNGKSLAIFEVIDLVRQAAAGLGHLHSCGIVHRDIKPANILIRTTESGLMSVIADLGLAAKLGPDGRAHGSKYSRLYRPPEVWAGAGHSVKSDVYQLGVVLYQLLGGRIDFSLGALDDDNLSGVIRGGRLLDLDTLGPHVEPSLRRTVRDATCEEDARVATMPLLSNALTECRAKHPNWKQWTEGELMFIERERNGKPPLRYEIKSTGARHEVRRLRKGHNGRYAQHGRLEVDHPALVRCRDFRKFVNKDGARAK